MTQRSYTVFNSLCADNSVGAITPAVLRDILESSVPSVGALHFADNVTPTTVSLAGTFVKAANATTLDQANRFTSPVDNRLLYTGVVPALVRVQCMMSITAQSNNQVLAFAAAVNGSINIQSKMRVKIGTGTDVQGTSIHSMILLQPNDYVELWLTNETSASQVTINHAYLSVEGWLT